MRHHMDKVFNELAGKAYIDVNSESYLMGSNKYFVNVYHCLFSCNTVLISSFMFLIPFFSY